MAGYAQAGINESFQMIDIFIVDDHAILRLSLRSLLERESDFSICGEADSANSALSEIGRVQPDLVLLDVSLPDMSGIELARTLHVKYPELRLLMLSGHGEKSHVDRAMGAGACGYVLKGNGKVLPEAIRQVLRGERYISSEIQGPDHFRN
jgi:DNA-binding NarL/FixJ family response regulator